MIVGCDLDALSDFVNHRMIRAAMSELQFVSAAAEGEPQYLVAEADAENRHFADQPPDIVDLRVQRFGVAGTVREKDAVGLQGKYILRGGERRHYRNPAARMYQPSQNISLDTEVVSDHVESRLGRCRQHLGRRT